MATTLVQDLQALLLTMAPAGGVWYGVNTTQPPVYPYIVWQRVASTPNVALDGPSDLQNTRVQIDIHAMRVEQTVALETALEAAMSASTIINVPLVSFDLIEPDTRTHRVVKEYSVWSSN